MKKVVIFVFIVYVTTISAINSPAQEKMVQQKSLYERLGGLDAMKAIVKNFGARISDDDRVNKKFAKSDAQRLDFYFVQKLCEVAGGPCKYNGLGMKKAHTNMGVTNGEHRIVVEHLAATLTEFKVSAAEQKEFLDLLAPMRPDIVEAQSEAIGTPLPSNFKPAPPLDKQTLETGPVNKQKQNKVKRRTKKRTQN